MNEAIALAPQNVGSVGLDDLLALIGLPSKRRSAAELSVAAVEILKGITSHVDGLLLRAIAGQTKGEFIAVRTEVFLDYAAAVTSLARLVRIIVPEPVIERVLGDSFSELDHEFREHGLMRFGGPAKDQAMFTIWTLRRTSRLISKVAGSGVVPESLKEKDEKLASDFSFYATWTQFHLDCMLAAMRFNKPIQLDVLPAIIDGLRAAVNAYGYARQGLNLRVPEAEPLIEAVQWDDEDQELLDSSMRDMALETLDD
jgi:hypothetical protein